MRSLSMRPRREKADLRFFPASEVVGSLWSFTLAPTFRWPELRERCQKFKTKRPPRIVTHGFKVYSAVFRYQLETLRTQLDVGSAAAHRSSRVLVGNFGRRWVWWADPRRIHADINSAQCACRDRPSPSDQVIVGTTQESPACYDDDRCGSPRPS